MARLISVVGSIGLTLILMMAGMGKSAWAAQGSWVGQVPRQTVAVSEQPLQSDSISPPPLMDGGEITRVRWALRTDRPAPALKVWLCQARLCVPLAGLRGETQRFAGQSASAPLGLRFHWPPGRERRSGSLIVTGGQVIVDYRDAHK